MALVRRGRTHSPGILAELGDSLRHVGVAKNKRKAESISEVETTRRLEINRGMKWSKTRLNLIARDYRLIVN